jgi:hypothetical protein
MLLRNRRHRRDGTVVIVVAICLVVLLSVVALSLDGGLVMDKRRQTQATADAAAYAAASELYVNWFTTHGIDTVDGSAVNTAKAVAMSNGFTDGVDGCTVTVNIPPLSGPFTGQPGHAEVIISYTQKRFFSRLFGTDDVVIGARAVGRGKRSTINNGILVLDPSAKDSLSIGGNGNIAITGNANIIVDSNHPEGMIANGTGATISASEFDLSGTPGWTTSGGATVSGPIKSGQDPTPDPLRFIPPPDPTGMPVQTTGNNGFHKTSGSWTLSPGVYNGGISIGGQASLTLQPGIYYMNGGGFSFTGQGDLYAAGVMIYNAPQLNSDVVGISGQGNITLSPMMAGPYQGIAIFQDRTASNTISISGSNATSMSISGTFYAAGGTLSVTGNGTQQTIGSQYISRLATIGGNGGFTVNWDPTLVPGSREVWLVE